MSHIETSLPVILPGSPVEGGFHGGFSSGLDGRAYRLIVPPKALSEIKIGTWKQAIKAVAKLDGLVLPNKRDGMTLFTLLGPNLDTTPELFRTGGAEAFDEAGYWLEDEYKFNPVYAWVQGFCNGNQFNFLKDFRLRCRAIRKFLI